MDVSSIISQRLNAMRKLQENPNDNAAMTLMQNSQKEVSSKSLMNIEMSSNGAC